MMRSTAGCHGNRSYAVCVVFSQTLFNVSLLLPHSNGIKWSLKSNQKIKSLLLSHHHSTSALVSEILMSVLQTVQKNNRQFTYGQTVQKKQQTIYIWTDSAKKQQTIYIWTDSAKKTTNNLHMDRQCKKTTNNLHMDRQCKKNNKQFTYGQTVHM